MGYDPAYKRSYYLANKEKINQTSMAYYNANKEQIAKKAKEYYQANKEQAAKRFKKYYEANKEIINKKHKEQYVSKYLIESNADLIKRQNWIKKTWKTKTTPLSL